MKTKEANCADVPAFLSINEAVKHTGISAFSLRRGCKDGTIPHIKAGEKYLINYHLLLERDDSTCHAKISQQRRFILNNPQLFKHSRSFVT